MERRDKLFVAREKTAEKIYLKRKKKRKLSKCDDEWLLVSRNERSFLLTENE